MKNKPCFLRVENILKRIIDSTINELGYRSLQYSISINLNQTFGDYSTNVSLLLANQEKKTGFVIASKITESISAKNNFRIIKEIKAEQNGFINFWIDDSVLLETIEYFSTEQFPLKNLSANDRRTYIVEYSSPNMVKPFTVGYLRSTIIGDAIANILSYRGKKVIKDNHFGDWGSQFGKLLYALKTWSSKEIVESSENPYSSLINLYLKFVEQEKIDPSLKKLSAQEYFKLESGDKINLELWQWLKEILTEGIQQLYNRLEIQFDVISWESLFVVEAREIINNLLISKIATVSNDATVVFFEKLPILLLRKSDGTTLYSSREIACDMNRKKIFGSDVVIINEVGSDQEIYFEQLFSVESQMKLFEPEQRIHLKHGMYTMEGIKMVSEKGNYIYLEDVLNFSKNSVLTKFPNVSESDAEIIGQASIRFNDLKNPHQSNVIFNMNTFTATGKGTGPYLQETVHRARNMIFFHQRQSETINTMNKHECLIARHLQKSYKYFENAEKELSTHYVANFASELALLYNNYCTYLESVNGYSSFTKKLSISTEKMVTTCLMLLGIKIPKKM